MALALDALIIGGDSQIGQALRTAICERGYSVLSTTRKWPPADGMLPFDLRYNSYLPPARVTFFCTGINGFKPCEADPAMAWFINVTRTVATAERLNTHRVVFLSSSACETHPDTVYGKCKQGAEDGFMKLGGACYRFGPVAFPGRDVYPNDTYSPMNLSTLTNILADILWWDWWQAGVRSLYNRDWVKEVA